MQKKWLLLPLSLFFCFSMGNHAVEAETILEQWEKEERFVCEEMTAAEEKEITLIANLMENVDEEGLMTHVNQHVLSSKKQLQTESNLKKYLKCPAIQADDRKLAGQMALYEQLLNYSERFMEDEESLEIKEVVLEENRNETSMYHLEVTFDNNKTVTSNYFYGVSAGINYYRYESNEMERRMEAYPKTLAFIQLELIEPLGKIIKNPLEKSADLLANYFEGKKELALEQARQKTEFTSRTLLLEFAMTEGDLGLWEDPYYAQQLYPIYSTYNVLERWEEIHHYNPDFPYPKEAIRKKDWYSIKDLIDEHQVEMSNDVYEYIFRNTLHEGITVENLAKGGLVKEE